jgi:hypothetical protein
VNANDKPLNPIRIKHVSILQPGETAAAPAKAAPKTGAHPAAKPVPKKPATN